jgi:hypothetical protein
MTMRPPRKLAGGSPITATTVAAPASSTEWIRQDKPPRPRFGDPPAAVLLHIDIVIFYAHLRQRLGPGQS